ncbi:MAG: cytochrome-c peroxidase [Methylococcaceae bacterium]
MKSKFNRLTKATLLSALLLSSIQVFADGLPSATSDSSYHYQGQPTQKAIELGKMLFFDKILSGNKDIACSTCHNPQLGTGDSLSVSIGTGGSGTGMLRVANSAPSRIIRNALPLYNSGATEFTAFLVDGAVMLGPNGEFLTPASGLLPPDMDNILAAQALIPLINPREMTGLALANDITIACTNSSDFPCIWTAVANRLKAIPAYVDLFMQAYPDFITGPDDITIADVGNAIAAYETVAFRSDDSPFDDYIRKGADTSVMSEKAIAGMNLFYGEAGCSSCHNGIFQTDHSFHAIAMPQIGSGLLTVSSRRDVGRRRLTGLREDLHKFKTPSLRNVVLTGPYGHDGAYKSLEAVIYHHLDPVNSLLNYDKTQAVLPPFPSVPNVELLDFSEQDTAAQVTARAITNELQPISLTNEQVNQLVEFMYALTGKSAMLYVSDKMPFAVPSGLPVAD